MPVKCLTAEQKLTIGTLYAQHRSIPELVVTFHRSSRTIARVLHELQLLPAKPRSAQPRPTTPVVPLKPLQPIPKSAQLPLFNFQPMRAHRTARIAGALRV